VRRTSLTLSEAVRIDADTPRLSIAGSSGPRAKYGGGLLGGDADRLPALQPGIDANRLPRDNRVVKVYARTFRGGRARPGPIASLVVTALVLGLMVEVVRYKLAMVVIVAAVVLLVGIVEGAAYALRRWRDRDKRAPSLTS
jgi:hypothetical protein